MRGLWIISGLLYTVTIILAVFTINQFYSQFVSFESVERSLQSVRRESRVRSIGRRVPTGRHVQQILCHVCYTVGTRRYYRRPDDIQDISTRGCSTKGAWRCDRTDLHSVDIVRIYDLRSG